MDNKVKCLPVYILIDTSQSMAPYEDVLNSSIESLYDTLITSPRISDFAKLCLISYNTNADVIVPMKDIQSLDALPQLRCGGVTDFTQALDLLRTLIDKDVPELGTQHQVLRPVAFVLTDGQPTDRDGHLSDAWRSGYASLVDRGNPRRPNMVPFGYGHASADTMKQIATIPGAAFLAKDDDTSDALNNVIPALLNSLVTSARAGALHLPTEVEGFIRVEDELVD
jgi:uncharacterized protein YegL